MSERTTPQGVEFLANSLFKHRQAERVIAVELPKHRSCMHLDTVMTHIDVDTFSVYPEVVRKDAQCWTLTGRTRRPAAHPGNRPAARHRESARH